ncbi:MAG: TetR/AcrR family transcriptional regulator C-terminal domain-containing protein [Clostridia bacterium]|nr:TetR/AcrR family transcriptional regulator C-terminal domain-containing protein [Clostridia bacterium]
MSQRTEKAIATSFKHLLQKKSLNKITISDIANDCGINRMTFYYHFRDIYDLIEWICDEDAKAALEEIHGMDSWYDGMVRVADTLYEDRTFIMGAFHSVERGKVEEYIHKVLSALFLDAVNELDNGSTLPQKDRQFLADFYTYAFGGILSQWIMSGMEKDDEIRLVEALRTVVSGKLQPAVDAFVTKNEEA